MKLVIHAHALRKVPLSPTIDGEFDELGGTIGRAVTSTMVLPDPERHVSRRHAEIQFSGKAFSIRNVGSGNPIEINGRAFRPGESAPLAAGDKLVIGGYAMRVSAGADDPARPPSPLAALRAQASRSTSREGVGEITADLPTLGPTVPVRPRASAKPPMSVQQLPTLASVHEPGMAAVVPPTAKVPAARAEGSRTGAKKTAPAAAAALSESPAPKPVESAASPAVLWAAFCDGAGVSLPMPQGLDPPTMRLMGQLMRHVLEGTLKLVAARTADRPELRAQGSAMGGKSNNPLKFAVDTQAALAQLLQPPLRGFMPGPEAVRDAMDDLLCHHAGTVAGTHAARQGMLDRFEPGRLEARLASQGSIDAVLPMNRRAKLWELYVERHPQLQDEARDDFQQLFASSFVKAYEEQLDRIRRARNAK